MTLWEESDVEGGWEEITYDVSVPSQKDAYAMAKAQGGLTPAQYGKQKKGEAKATSGFVKSFADSLGKDFSRKVTSKRSGRSTVTRLGKKAASFLSPGESGLSLLSKAAPIALRLIPVAAAVGALWYLSKRADDQAKKAMVAEYAANQEAFLKRPMRDDELKAYLPIWEKQADSRLLKARATAPAIKTLR